MKTKIVAGASAVLVVGIAVALAQPAVQSPKTPGPNVNVSESQLKVIPGLLNSVNELKKEVAALKSQNAAQNSRITELEKKLAGATIVTLGLQKAIEQQKAELTGKIDALTTKFRVHNHLYYRHFTSGPIPRRTSHPCKPGTVEDLCEVDK